YFLEDIIATYLYTTRRRAEEHLGCELDTIVLGRPVRYSDDETQNKVGQERLLQAAFRAGYKTVYLQYEPIAAAYHYETGISEEQNVLVFDFGGGTLDISIMRLGNPKTRQVLATGGIPIAGDIFDRKIVRHKFPKHFGEGSTYIHGHNELPIPPSFYDAFEDWQTLLQLQMPDRIEQLKLIAQMSKNKKVQALVQLISSSYALKMYDLAETSKRTVSDSIVTPIRFSGPGFSVADSLTRAEFEQLIRSDVRDIAQRLDQVIVEAGLKPEQIDAVIRTGGSSQIPLFIQMLEARFGADKVLDIDTFSSVTSGLGVMAHELEQGRSLLKAHHAEDYPPAEYLKSTHEGGIPTLDFDTLTKYIDLTEGHDIQIDEAHVVLHMRDDLICAVETGDQEVTLNNANSPAGIIPVEAQVVLMTTDYRVLVKTARQLASMETLGLSFEDSEGFHQDDFGNETICAINKWNELQDADQLIIVTDRGYGRAFMGKTMLENLLRPVPYQMTRVKGNPVALIGTNVDSHILILSSSGRVVRLRANHVQLLEERLMKFSTSVSVVDALALHPAQMNADLTLVTATGYVKRVSMNDIPVSSEINMGGEKILSRTNAIGMIIYDPHSPIYVLTSQRMILLEDNMVTRSSPDETTDHKLMQLRKNEHILNISQR
ncbi:MAG: Hsp70 family protein, partial [Aggregatilineales bacterium]